MQTDADHNRILKKIANEILKPNGLFQKGTSRVWIDDNGWFLIIVEFQPSAWSKGAYLNVGIHYLWDDKDSLTFDYGHRFHSFVSFDGNEEKIAADMESLAELAVNQVVQYRRFRDLEYARVSILQNKAHHVIRTLYSKMMICGLNKNMDAVNYCRQLMEAIPLYSELAWTGKYLLELQDRIAPIIDDQELFYRYICDKVNSQRNYWRSKSSMKKLKETFTVEFADS